MIHKCYFFSYLKIEGAFIQGIGLYTMEELKYSSEGVLYTRGPDQYKIPAVCDIPEQFSVSLLSPSQNPYAIYASKVSRSSQGQILRSQAKLRNYFDIKHIYVFSSSPLAFQTSVQ